MVIKGFRYQRNMNHPQFFGDEDVGQVPRESVAQ